MISLHEIDFSNRNFWVGYMAASFPTAWEEETDMSLTELMIENGMCDTGWWDNFTKYYDGVLEESDGYVDERVIRRGIRLKNQRFFNRQICADAQIRELSAAWRISVKYHTYYLCRCLAAEWRFI